MTIESIESQCNICVRETDHDVLWRQNSSVDGPNGEILESRTLILRCRGCGDFAIRHEQWFHSGIPDLQTEFECASISYVPPRTWRRPPVWIDKIPGDDLDLKGMLDEVYSATNTQQVRLLSIGVRTVLDHVMTRILGGDFSSFDSNLDEMVRQGHLTQRQRNNLSVVIDAGSASTHRSFRPPQDLLEEMVTVMESIIRDHYVTGPMLQTARTIIPPRPPRKKRT